MLRDIRVGGVPEHFNAPIIIAKDKKFYENEKINLIWSFCKGGTGEMTEKLEKGELDVAILLTDGITLKICQGGSSRIVGTYVSSPLVWGIYAHADSPYHDVQDIINKNEDAKSADGASGDGNSNIANGVCADGSTAHELDNNAKSTSHNGEKKSTYTYAISRHGSGSHIMAFVDLFSRNFDFQKNNLNFFVCKNFDGAREALKNKSADFFMWETFTSSHMVESGEWRKIGERQTAWPAFLFAASAQFLQHPENVDLLKDFIKTTKMACVDFKKEENKESSLSYICDNFKIKKEAADFLYTNVTFLSQANVKFEALNNALTYLKKAGVLTDEQIKEGCITENSLVNNKICNVCAKLPSEMYDWRVAAMFTSISDILRKKKEKLNEHKDKKLRVDSSADKQTEIKEDEEVEELLVEDLVALEHLDQYHYLGHVAIEELIRKLNIDKQHCVLDLGSGICGPARYLCKQTKCKIVCIEIQKDLADAAIQINQKCNLQHLIEVKLGDICEMELEENLFDFAFSLLVVLHIPNRLLALQKLFRSLKPGGKFIIEDMYLPNTKKLSEADLLELRDKVGCFSLTSLEEYEKDLKNAGFVNIHFTDMTPRWEESTEERYTKLMENQKEIIETQGKETFDKRKVLYEVTRDFFHTGKLGGTRIYGEKP